MSIADPRKYQCPYCNAKFIREKTMHIHVCEQKRRHFAKSEKHVRIGFDVFNRFFQLHYNTQKTYEEFARSRYYHNFVQFGSFLNNVHPLYPDKFIDYLLRTDVPIAKWTSDTVYDEYIWKLVKTESVETALERSINSMIAWGEEKELPWHTYFVNVSKSRATYNIKDGYISPWLVLNSNNGKKMIKQFDHKQLETVEKVLDIRYWLQVFKNKSDDTQLVKDIIEQAGL